MEDRLLYLVSVLLLGIAAQWIAWRFRLPAILVLLVAGFASGQFADPGQLIGQELLFSFVSLAVAVILFEGGLSLQIRELRESGRAVIGLITIGVVVTWALSGLAAWGLMDFGPIMAALAGAILVVTGPTVIIPLLRHVRPARRMASVVKWEGIVNDPIGAVLAVLVFESLQHAAIGQTATTIISGLLQAVVVSSLVAVVAAVALIQLLKRFLIPDFLQNAVFLSAVLGAFTAANAFESESGLVTVTLLGVILANQRTVSIKHVIEFKENLQVLLISTLFIVLAATLKVDDLISLGIMGPVFVGALLIIRPIAVFVSTWATDLTHSERWFLAVMAPRGIVAAAVSSLLALQVAELARQGHLAAEMAVQAERLVPLTFLVIIGTVTIYGLIASPLAQWLKIAEPHPQGILFAGAGPFNRALASAVQRAGFSVLLIDTNQQNVAAARMAGLPVRSASILSEYVREEIELSGIGRLLAMTPNQEVNALAALEFGEVFGRAGVYQLTSGETVQGRQKTAASHHKARLLFSEDATYWHLARRLAAGATIKSTSLTDEFNFDDFRALYGQSALVLATKSKTGELAIGTVGMPLAPKPGQTVISLVDSEPKAADNGK